MRFDILSLFPEMFSSPFEHSIIKRAQKNNFIEIFLHNIRDYATDKHKTADDVPYGGGGGMVMKVEPIDRALSAIGAKTKEALTVLLAPQGEQFNQKIAKELSHYKRIVLICGHYEGIDERVRENLVDREISIGDFVLTGGELPAMIIVDAVSRFIAGVIGNDNA
ncbi:MAG: tRNA (guanosine(37)-N1)-methyltransferase TrmD, partial [Deltaproteobacteria bacterium]